MNLFSKKPLIIDGGLGTMLQSAGLPAGASPDAWNIERPEIVEGIHRAYIDAGAQLITANTFGSNAPRQKRGKYPAAELAAVGVRLARRAVQDAPEPCYVAFDVGPLGVLLEPMGELTFEEAVAFYSECIRAGVSEQPDCILIETMCDLNEACAAVAAAKAHGNGLPVYCTCSFDARGRLMTGTDIASVVMGLSDAGVDGLGCNCGVGPEQLVALLPQFVSATSLPILMCPNAGLPAFRDGKTCYDVAPREFAGYMRALLDGGASGLGGCCGTTPEHIRALKAACCS